MHLDVLEDGVTFGAILSSVDDIVEDDELIFSPTTVSETQPTTKITGERNESVSDNGTRYPLQMK